ncbi:hypothetical protein R1sor_011048 [Riccia sorocarpa]|uniref:Uncharacterized protein n=1 Tax=Riccia sorocarpa TaxID=122646 RepID=A0ABD3I3H7_9MARC
MGGGAVWSRVARLASTVSPAVRAASPSANSCSFCKLNSSLQAAAKQSSSSSLKMHQSCACSPETTPRAVNAAGQKSPKSVWDSDDWEFADEEEERIDRLVFGPLPTQQEVEEASTDLQNALRLGLLAPACDDLQAPTWGTLLPTATAAQAESPDHSGSSKCSHHSKPSAASDVTEEREIEEISRSAPPSHELDWMEPPTIRNSRNALRAPGRSAVQEAFYQFESNPEVQGMVVSLATDPNIWRAVMTNKEIQEFRRKLQGGDKGLLGEKAVIVTEESRDSKGEGSSSFLERCRIFCQNQMAHFMVLLNGLIDSFFKAGDKENSREESGEFVDRTVKSVTMLALLVLFIVILKRLPVQAA